MAPPMKVCSRPACRKLISHELTYCEKHSGIVNKEYNAHRRTYDKEYISFYNTKAWRDVRKVALIRDGYICKLCEGLGKYTAAQLVHHHVEVKEDWEMRLELNNLQSLCESCHQKIPKSF